ncbi:alpha/beta hydrolase [Cellulomonas sp. H30R-01]|uniref:alpha/beta hydrolase n=1 Tax=Cellulomonas sp. H30R-01 TaxID=2704467 RepID=UPI00138B1CA6|nr:alpha/beta hydrolase [Cellulomonas sp. H30R-01]QHT57991.1 alpha/beta hydrolase [Cellulomonas sp. H30R-01]
MSRWAPDVLGDDYRVRTLDLRPDDEGAVVASLVRYSPPTDEPVRASRAVLYVHGWSDYFFQTGLAEHWHSRGAAFYALDLRKYGRSLRPWQTPGYVDDLATYDEEIEAALDVVRRDVGAYGRVMVMGHSTGGLVAALWADRHPGELDGLVLNSPWLELQGSSVVRHVSGPAIAQLARFQPKAPLPNIDPGYYARTLSASSGGEWTYDLRWRPVPSFPVRAGWLRAVIAGHATVARGLHVTAPILTLASSRTVISPRWSEDMRSADVVLDVELVARRAVQLGPLVTVVRIAGGLHDLTLSPQPVRTRFYAELDRWTAAYGWG